MPYRSDFFTAKLVGGEYDRKYNADRFASRFADLISNGIVITGGGVIGTELQVSVVAGTMKTSVNLGKANINGYFVEVYDSAVELTHTAADATNPRIDRVVLELNLTDDVRAIEVKIVNGTAAASPVPPALVQTSTVYQLSLAQVSVPANVVSLPTDGVTDERLTQCGLANILIGIDPPDANSALMVSVDDANFSVISGTNQQVVNDSIDDLIAGKASIASPALTGTPTAPTPADSTNSTQIATTAFVKSVIAKTPSVHSLVANTLLYDGVNSTKKITTSPAISISAGTYLVFWKIVLTAVSGNVNASTQNLYFALADASGWSPIMLGGNNVNMDLATATISGFAVVDLPSSSNMQFCIWSGYNLKAGAYDSENTVTLVKLD